MVCARRNTSSMSCSMISTAMSAGNRSISETMIPLSPEAMPAAGIASGESGILVSLIERLPPDIAVLIIEHDMELVFRLAQTITVLVQGSVLVVGPPDAIAADPKVREVYLG